MPRRPRHQPPTDVRRLGRALAQEGMDLRHWVSYATVVAVDDDGEQSLSNPNAVVISPASVDVDVVLEPSGYPMTCSYGERHGTVYVCGPIHVGDQVLVGIPDGSVSMIGRILCVVSGPNGAEDAVPVGDDDKPLFKNDRYLVYAKGVPIELRTDGGQSLLVNPDGTIQIGGADATEQLVLGTTYRQAEAEMNNDLVTEIGTMAGAAEAMTPSDIAIISGLAATVGAFLTAFKVFAPAWLAEVQAFEAKASGYLSEKNKTR